MLLKNENLITPLLSNPEKDDLDLLYSVAESEANSSRQMTYGSMQPVEPCQEDASFEVDHSALLPAVVLEQDQMKDIYETITDGNVPTQPLPSQFIGTGKR